ncbi:MAG: HEAT repeat domain-containing protein, partial [Planctomycetota bacterium]
MKGAERDETLKRSLGDLRSEVGLIRRRAIHELARLQDPRALDALMASAARDVEAQVRADATRAVESIRKRGDADQGDRREHRGADEPGEATDQWSARVLKTASSEGDVPRAPLARTKKLKKGALDETAIEHHARTAGPPPIRSSAAENARALDAARQRSSTDSARVRRELLDEALQGMSIPIESKRYGFKLTVPLLDGRRQFVRVGYEQSDFESDKVIVIFSPCGKADPKQYKWALELNHGLSYGKLGLVAGPHGDEFVMSATLLEATADPAELRKAILSVAEKADKVEQTFGP